MKTVSRVLNNEPTVREETRARVQAVAQSMNYRPDPSARSLAGRRSYLVALLYDNPSANYLMEILMGVVDACQAHHYGMVVQPLNYESPDFLRSVESLVQFSKLDGLILTPPITDSVELLDRLDQLCMPYSCVSPRNREGTIGVTLEEHDAAADMIEYLVSLGHTRIAHIKGHPSHGASEWRLVEATAAGCAAPGCATTRRWSSTASSPSTRARARPSSCSTWSSRRPPSSPPTTTWPPG